MSETARNVASAVLLRIWEDEAYASAALSTALDESRMQTRDRGLATELVYGVLRTEPHLFRRVQSFGKPQDDDLLVLSHLLLAAYQIEFLDRVPARAAVNEAVSAVQNARGRSVGGFVNAVLRRVSEVPPEKRLTLEEAILQSTPSWLRKRMERSVGAEAARLLLVDVRQTAPALRLAQGAKVPGWWASETEPLTVCPQAFRYTAGGDPRRHSEFQAGTFAVQELGAQLVGRALDARSGEHVLDVCAGRGQKTALLAELVGPNGRVVATDLHEHKLSALRQELARHGSAVETAVWDWTEPPPAEYRGRFDRVLVDAPCSGVGTLRRRPEILRRLTPDDPERLRELQSRILRNASLALKPSGCLVYATCSVLRTEGEDVLEAVADDLVPLAFGPSVVQEAFPPDASSARLLPHELGTDGYFVARLAQRRTAG